MALLAEKMLACLLQYPQGKDLINDNILSVCPTNTAAVLAAVKQGAGDTLNGHSKKILEASAFQAEVESPEKPEQEIKLCSNFLIKLSLQNQLKNISEQIKAAEQQGSTQKLTLLIQQFNELAKQVKA